ncbi:hypothetical protein BMS3Abin03_01777 [bacterium BMS3Abin03]|nr:hypothetical protein BMS3Abin03_01777 [bacterium BMS3Abin03]
MEKYNKLVCVFADHTIFNSNAVTKFEHLTGEHTVILYSLLLMNNLDNLKRSNLENEIAICLEKNDRDFLPKEFLDKNHNLIFVDKITDNESIDMLNGSYFENYSSNLLLRVETMGISAGTYDKIFNLLSVEDEVIVIGKTVQNRVTFIGFNSIKNNFLKSLLVKKYNYDKILKEIAKRDVFVHTLDDFELVTTFEEFKNLYYQLSKKDSLSYCSQEMHERFTNLFIEYKDQLK